MIRKWYRYVLFKWAMWQSGHRGVPYYSPFGVWICNCSHCSDPHYGEAEVSSSSGPPPEGTWEREEWRRAGEE